MANEKQGSRRQPVLLSFRFLSTSLIGSLTVSLVCTFAPLPAQIGVLGSSVSVVAGLFLSYMEQEERREKGRAELLEKVQLPLSLAPDHDLFDQYTAFTNSLVELSKQKDLVLRRYALLKLSSISEQLRSLSSGRVVFSTTETWRTVYREILKSPDLKRYRSVSWVKTKDYWQDQPGKQDMRLNFELSKDGLLIERIVILRGELWPRNEALPSGAIRPWIDEQHASGIKLALVRESEILSEPDLLMDFGIYGERATGIEDLDDQSRTVRFTLLFDRQSLSVAQDRFSRLSLYAKPYSEILGPSAKKSAPQKEKEG